MIKTVLWDIDATLLDMKLPERNAIKAAFQEFGLGTVSEKQLDAYPAINQKWWDATERGEVAKEIILWKRFEEFLDYCGVDSSHAYDFSRSYMRRLGDTVCFNPHGKETLEELKKRGYRQYVVTNGVTLSQEKKIGNSGIGDYMDGVFISEQVGFEKPTKEFFDKVLEKLEFDSREEILIVGDSLSTDMPGGVNAGIKTCWYNPKKKENKKGIPIDYTISDLAEVVSIVS